MNRDNNNTATPILTLEPFVAGVVGNQEAALKESQAPDMDIWTTAQQNICIQGTATTILVPEPIMVLIPEEQEMVDDFVVQADSKDSNMVLQYGTGVQEKITDSSEGALDYAKAKDLGEVGDMLIGVVRELRSFEPEEENEGFLGLFKHSLDRLDNMRTKYGKIKTNVDRICKILESRQTQFLRDIAVLDKVYELSTNYFREPSTYVSAGKKWLEQAQTVELPALAWKAKQIKQSEDTQAANDMASLCGRSEKEVHDLEPIHVVSFQMAPQTRLVQSNDTLISGKIQPTIANTTPLWKNQTVLVVGVNHSGQAAKAQRGVTDMTNKLLRKSAEVLKIAAIETAKGSERGIISIETLEAINQPLITTLDEVVKTQTEGHEKRRVIEQELVRMEGELKRKSPEMSR